LNGIVLSPSVVVLLPFFVSTAVEAVTSYSESRSYRLSFWLYVARLLSLWLRNCFRRASDFMRNLL